MSITRRSLLQSLIAAPFAAYASMPVTAVPFDYDGPPVTLKFSHFAPKQHPVIQASLVPWLDSINTETRGKIHIESYFGGSLLGAKEGFRGVMAGIADVAPAYVMYAASSFHLMLVNDLPFAYASPAVADMVAMHLYPTYFKKEYEAMGVYLAQISFNGGYNLFSKRALHSVGDLKNLKIRSSGGIMSEIIKSLGAVPVALPVTDAYNAFQRGIVDAVFLYNTGLVGYKLDELTTHMLKLNIDHPSNAWAWNKAKWDSLPTPIKSYLYTKFQTGSLDSGIAFQALDDENERKFIANGMKVYMPNAKEASQFKAKVDPLWSTFLEKNRTREPQISQLLSDLRNLNERYKDISPNKMREELARAPVSGMI